MLARSAATIFEVVTFLGGIIATWLLLEGISPGNSAVQTASTSATAVAFVAIPYAIAGIFHRSASRSLMLEQAAALRGAFLPEVDA